MLERATGFGEPGLRFVQQDIADFTSEQPFDVVFSNAALQWVPDHPALFRRVAQLVSESGELAVQMPANHDHPSHTIAADLAGDGAFARETNGYVRKIPVLRPEEYAAILHSLGFAEQTVQLRVYGHVLRSADDVVEWTRGTLLTDYAAHMSAATFARFLDEYRRRVLGELGDERPYFYAFKRVLLWGARRQAGGGQTVSSAPQPP